MSQKHGEEVDLRDRKIDQVDDFPVGSTGPAQLSSVKAPSTAPLYNEYVFKGGTKGNSVFHRSAGKLTKGDNVRLSPAHAAELRAAGFELKQK